MCWYFILSFVSFLLLDLFFSFLYFPQLNTALSLFLTYSSCLFHNFLISILFLLLLVWCSRWFFLNTSLPTAHRPFISADFLFLFFVLFSLSPRFISFCEWMPENEVMNGPAFIPAVCFITRLSNIPPPCGRAHTHSGTLIQHI